MKIPPGPLSPSMADMLTRKLTLLESLLKIRTEAPLTFSLNNGTPVLGINAQKRIIAKLTGHDASTDYFSPNSATSGTGDDDCRYSWVEQDLVPSACTTEDLEGGLRGYIDKMPAVDINGSATIAEDTVVELFLAQSGDHWRFAGPGSGGTGGGQCCIGAPTGIFAISQETCCDSTQGFSTATWFLFWDQDCVPYIFDDETEAIQAAEGLGLDTTVYGRCTSR